MNTNTRPKGQDAGASLQLRIGSCAKTARVNRDVINQAMGAGELPFSRDADGHRVASPNDLATWMQRRREGQLLELRGRRHGR